MVSCLLKLLSEFPLYEAILKRVEILFRYSDYSLSIIVEPAGELSFFPLGYRGKSS